MEAAFHVTFDFLVGAGRSVWRSAGPGTIERPRGADLRSVPAFEEFTDAELDVVAHQMRIGRYSDRHVFVREGQANSWDGMWVILDGRVGLVREESGHVFTRTMHRGECFGLVALVDRGERSATCAADGPCVVANLDRARFEALRRGSNREVARKLQWVAARQLARDFQALSATLRDLLR